jgi:hypothetical protein
MYAFWYIAPPLTTALSNPMLYAEREGASNACQVTLIEIRARCTDACSPCDGARVTHIAGRPDDRTTNDEAQRNALGLVVSKNPGSDLLSPCEYHRLRWA